MSEEAEQLAAQAGDAVRGVIAQAEDRAAEIISDADTRAANIREQAEAEAAQIRQRGEADARAQIEAAKRALDELGGNLVAAASEALPASETGDPHRDPEPEPQPGEDPDSDPESEPAPEPAPEQPAESPGAPEAPVSPAAGNGDDAAARLVAMKMAVDGKDRAQIEAELAQKFGPGDRSALLDDVLSRAAR